MSRGRRSSAATRAPRASQPVAQATETINATMPPSPVERILPRTEVERIVAEAQAAGRRCVFTNGIFDLLHLGHAHYLRRARALGDLLVVGMNSDASTRRLKGPLRPLTPERERAELLASLSVVDYVTIFDEDTAEATIEALRPAIYVKGADYAANEGGPRARDYLISPQDLAQLLSDEAPSDPQLEPLAGLGRRLPEARVVAAYGGSLALLAYLPGHSTTEVIERIVERYGHTSRREQAASVG